jgi:formate hydrogenlyase subunit 6/NADH:ubiquinone oxidoreductase subunit I
MSKKIGRMFIEVTSSLFKKPATSNYPFKKREVHKSYNGKIAFEQSKCIGCNICVKNCPSKALIVTKVADKVFEMTISLAKCIFCGQCVVSCPKKALSNTSEFELAQSDKIKLTVKL